MLIKICFTSPYEFYPTRATVCSMINYQLHLLQMLRPFGKYLFHAQLFHLMGLPRFLKLCNYLVSGGMLYLESQLQLYLSLVIKVHPPINSINLTKIRKRNLSWIGNAHLMQYQKIKISECRYLQVSTVHFLCNAII